MKIAVIKSGRQRPVRCGISALISSDQGPGALDGEQAPEGPHIHLTEQALKSRSR